jgi:hypothetical protein
MKSWERTRAASKGGNTTAGAAGGVGVPVKALSGRRFMPACTALTASTSPGPLRAVRVSVSTMSVSDRNTWRMPAGGVPFQFGPAMRYWPAALPVAREPMYAKLYVNRSIHCCT